VFFFFQAEDGIRDFHVTGVQTCALPICNCDLLIIAVKTDPSQGAKGVSLVVAEVSDDTPGFERGRLLKKIGQKGQDTTELFFDRSEERRVGKECSARRSPARWKKEDRVR